MNNHFTKSNSAAILKNPKFFHNKKLINIISDHIENEVALDLNIKRTILGSLDDYISKRKSYTASQNSLGDIIGKEDEIIVKNHLCLNIAENLTAKINTKSLSRPLTFSDVKFPSSFSNRGRERDSLYSASMDGIVQSFNNFSSDTTIGLRITDTESTRAVINDALSVKPSPSF